MTLLAALSRLRTKILKGLNATLTIETLLPILYLKGISTAEFSEALAALLGKDAAGLSASAIGRLKDSWLDELTAWQKRDLSAKRYVYILGRRHPSPSTSWLTSFPNILPSSGLVMGWK